jgi:hypothetical protein
MEMSKVLKKEIPQLVVIMAFFLLCISGLLCYLYVTKRALIQRQQYLEVAIKEALENGANKDTLKSEFVKSDTLK